MSHHIYGNSEARRVMQEAEELRLKINAIKETDPVGWEKTELEIAKEIVVHEFVKLKISPYNNKEPHERLTMDEHLEKKAREQIKNISSLEQLQTFVTQHALPIEDWNFEQMVYETYDLSN